ncbi:MAG: rod shape-determining protein [Eubacteriales bacterium]
MGANDIGIDLGTVNTLIYNKNRGIVLNEPTVIATETYSGRVIALGEKARAMLGRTPDTVTAAMPVQKGVIADYDKTCAMLREYVARTKKRIAPINAIVTVPYTSTEVERRAVEGAVYAAHARKVILLDKPIAAAIGCGLPVFEASGHMVVDMGGGSTEISVVSMGGIVAQTTLDDCGLQMDREIVNYVKFNYGVVIGDLVAEELKIRLGSAVDKEIPDFMTVSGISPGERLPMTVTVSSDDIRAAIGPQVQNIVDGLRNTMEHLNPELASDIMQNGIALCGGVSQMPGWVELIQRETGVHTEIVVNPMETVAVGAGRALDMIDRLK